MKIAICGSMHFALLMKAIAEYLEKKGFTCFLPEGIEDYIKNPIEMKRRSKDEGALRKKQHDLIRKYAAVIDGADAILAVNDKKGAEENYIGGNVLIEMGHAFIEHKKIYILNRIPQNPYCRQEILAMEPIVLFGDLDRIR